MTSQQSWPPPLPKESKVMRNELVSLIFLGYGFKQAPSNSINSHEVSFDLNKENTKKIRQCKDIYRVPKKSPSNREVQPFMEISSYFPPYPGTSAILRLFGSISDLTLFSTFEHFWALKILVCFTKKLQFLAEKLLKKFVIAF